MTTIQEEMQQRMDSRPDKHTLASQRPEYRVWAGMVARCYNPKDKRFHRYGGRGIIVCDRWRYSFPRFFMDMGPKPSTRHSIDRIDNDGIYEPDNCRWATPPEQARNRASTRLITCQGRTQCLKDWAQELGVTHGAILDRIRRGWPLEDALTIEKQPSFSHRTNRMLTFSGETLCVTHWARKIGMRPITLRKRLEAGWTIEKALTTPVETKYGKPY